jgi:hypothetical protein
MSSKGEEHTVTRCKLFANGFEKEQREGRAHRSAWSYSGGVVG